MSVGAPFWAGWPIWGGRRRGASAAAKTGEGTFLPRNVFRYVLEASGWHQPFLVLLTVAVFLIELAPLELQRRIVNDVVKHRDYRLVITLCAIYVGVVVAQGVIKLILNVYRNWIGECATRALRRLVRAAADNVSNRALRAEASGIEISMIVAEVEPIGGFVGESISEPLLQGGILLSMLAYMIHLEPWMAVAAVGIFVPQLIFVPLIQKAINRRTAVRVRTLRRVSVSLAGPEDTEHRRRSTDDAHIERVFKLNMGIFRFKFSMNFLMNLCNHLQIIAALLIGSWFVITDRLEIGGVVAFISAIGRINDPWGDLVNYFRDVSGTQVKFALLADAINRLSAGKTGVKHSLESTGTPNV